MANRANTSMKNFLTDAFATDFNGGTLEIRSGAQPATGDDLASGTLLATIVLPADAFAAAAAGSAALSGTWQDAVDAAGIAGWFRMLNAAGTRSIDGSITGTGGGGDMELQNTNLAVGQEVTVTGFTLSALSGA